MTQAGGTQGRAGRESRAGSRGGSGLEGWFLSQNILSRVARLHRQALSQVYFLMGLDSAEYG